MAKLSAAILSRCGTELSAQPALIRCANQVIVCCQQTITWLSQRIKAGWAESSVPQLDKTAAESLAKRLYFAWLGASLIAKTSQTNTPLAEVWQMTTSQLGR